MLTYSPPTQLVGRGPVGFINPVIYQHPEAFTDITKGKNPGCNTEGFPASEGWDPITGLGEAAFRIAFCLTQLTLCCVQVPQSTRDCWKFSCLCREKALAAAEMMLSSTT